MVKIQIGNEVTSEEIARERGRYMPKTLRPTVDVETSSFHCLLEVEGAQKDRLYCMFTNLVIIHYLEK